MLGWMEEPKMDKKDESARRAGYMGMLKRPPMKIWPPYCFTELCPDWRYRLGGELYGEVITRRGDDE